MKDYDPRGQVASEAIGIGPIYKRINTLIETTDELNSYIHRLDTRLVNVMASLNLVSEDVTKPVSRPMPSSNYSCPLEERLAEIQSSIERAMDGMANILDRIQL